MGLKDFLFSKRKSTSVLGASKYGIRMTDSLGIQKETSLLASQKYGTDKENDRLQEIKMVEGRYRELNQNVQYSSFDNFLTDLPSFFEYKGMDEHPKIITPHTPEMLEFCLTRLTDEAKEKLIVSTFIRNSRALSRNANDLGEDWEDKIVKMADYLLAEQERILDYDKLLRDFDERAKFRSRLKKFLPPSYSKRIYIRGTQKDLYRNGQYIELQFLTPKVPREPFKIMLKRDGAYTLLCGAKKWEYSEEISKFWGIYKKERMMSKKAKEDSEKTEENEK